jgi:hypothetical protein
MHDSGVEAPRECGGVPHYVTPYVVLAFREDDIEWRVSV